MNNKNTTTIFIQWWYFYPLQDNYSNMVTELYKGHVVAIQPDEDAISPQEEGDTNLFVVASHKDVYIPCPEGSNFETVRNDYSTTHHIYSIEAYIHSGVKLAVEDEGEFPDRKFDVSTVGLAFVAKTEYPGHDEALEACRGLIEYWNTYLTGEVYSILILFNGAEVYNVGSFYSSNGGTDVLIEAHKEVDAIISNQYSDDKLTRKLPIEVVPA